MSYAFYKIVHIFGLIALITSSLLIPLCSNNLQKLRKLVLSLHGIASLAAFIAGFGLIAKMNYSMELSSLNLTTMLVLTFSILACLTYYLFLSQIQKSDKANNLTGLMALFLIITLWPIIIIDPLWLSIKISVWLALSLSPLIQRIFIYKPNQQGLSSSVLISYISILTIVLIAIISAVR